MTPKPYAIHVNPCSRGQSARTLDIFRPTVLKGDDARCFEAWLEADCPPEG
jgi:hypothetical protein